MKPKHIIIALAAILACSCSAGIIDNTDFKLVIREFSATLDGGTKTSLEQGGKVLWDASGESITMVDEQGRLYNFSQKSVSADRRTATFSGTAPESGLVLAVYPASGSLDYDDGAVSLSIPCEQQALEGGFPTANLTLAEVSDDSNSLTFRNACSMIGIKVNASNISSISIRADETSGGALAGPAHVAFEEGIPCSVSDIAGGNSSITLGGPIASGKQYYAMAWPGTYNGLTVTFTDTDGRTATFTKSSTFTLRRSKILPVSEFTISDSDWDGGNPESDVFTLVTSASTLSSGDEVLIVYRSGSLALSAISSNGNYRTGSSVTISDNKIEDPESAAVLTLEEGANSGTWAFKDSNSYLSSASSGNSLQNSSSKNANSSWSINIDSSGNASIKAQAGASPYIRYNTGSPRFSCYNSDSNQQAVAIFSRSSSGSHVATPKVTTLAADNIGMADASLQASFKNIPTSPDPTAAFFRWGTSASSMNNVVYDNETLLNTAAGTFSASLTGLTEATTYYYQAVITLADGTDVEGSVMSFSTRSSQQTASRGYLDCYEVPAIDVTGTLVRGNEVSQRGYLWYRFDTPNSMRKVVTHTFNDSGRQFRNYTVLVDGNNKAPLWDAFIMHQDVFFDSNLGRGSWTYDPAVPSSWQNSETLGDYHKGHLVASNYRQNYTSARNQTFYYTNQAPQYQTQFNDGIWNNMEQRIAAVAPSGSDTLYVVVGVLYEGTIQRISEVPIPSHFYTCLMKCSFNSSKVMTAAQGCAYLFENEPYPKGSSYNSYKVKIKDVEQRAGFDFFHNVPDNFESAAENETASIL